MKSTISNMSALALLILAFTLNSCSKNDLTQTDASGDKNLPVRNSGKQAAVSPGCQAFALCWNASTNSEVYRLVSGVASYTYAFTVNLSGVPITKMTGLSKNISTGDFLGTTDNFSSVPNRLFNINTSTGAATVIGGLVCVGGTSPSVPVGATVTDISDIERDFSTTSTGDYYALSGDKRIVKINGTSGQVTYLPPLASSISGLKGLTISCGNGLLYVINPTLSVIPGQYGAVWQIDKVTGATIAGPLSYGSTNPSWMSTDFGLHFDCCGDYFMGANSLGPVMTVSRPAAGFFAFIGAGTGSTAVRSTYDFARY